MYYDCQELKEEVEISILTFHVILTENLNMNQGAGKFIPPLMTNRREIERTFACNYLNKPTILTKERWIVPRTVEYLVETICEHAESIWLLGKL